MKIFRWKAIVPLLLLVVALIAVWLLLLDLIVQKTIEFAGAQITGARVDIESVDVQLAAGRLVIEGLQAADPNAPMTNMVEADELIADIRIAPLLQKKVIIDTLAVRGVRFGTPRTTSGELDRTVETTGAVVGRISRWTEELPIPALSLRGLGSTVNVNAIESDSLKTVQLSRRIVTAADSMWERWQTDIRSLDLSTEIDSARAVARRLGNINLRRLSLTRIREITETFSSARNVVRAVEVKRDNLQNLRSGIRNGVRDLQESIRLFDDMRDLDYRYASGDVTWESTGEKSGIEEFVWRTISSVQTVGVDVTMRSSPEGYDLKVSSNVAGELSRGLQRQLGDQIRRAQDQVRSAVNERIRSYTDQARARAESIENQIDQKIEELQAQLEEARAELEERLKNITDRLPAGIIPPG